MILQPPLSTTAEKFRSKRNARIRPPSAWLLACVLLQLNAGLARAQCAHNPTVTPNNLIFCPNSGSDTLWTQPYQAYQWFKDGVLQSGDTLRYRRVTSADAGSMFSVDATLNGCTERSPQVMVDGWVFLLPVVSTQGLMNPLCQGDTLRLILLPPYEINIQWTNGGLPIPGANDDTLIVTTDGDYSVSGAPEICPNFNQQLGVTMSYRFLPCSSGWDGPVSSSQNSPSWHPNPLRGEQLRLLGDDSDQEIEFQLLDPLGRCVLRQILPSGNTTLNWANEANQKPAENGIYTIVWTRGQKTRTQRLVVNPH